MNETKVFGHYPCPKLVYARKYVFYTVYLSQNDPHASKHMNYRINYQPRLYQKFLKILLILSDIDFVLSNSLWPNVQTLVGEEGHRSFRLYRKFHSLLFSIFYLASLRHLYKSIGRLLKLPSFVI